MLRYMYRAYMGGLFESVVCVYFFFFGPALIFFFFSRYIYISENHRLFFFFSPTFYYHLLLYIYHWIYIGIILFKNDLGYRDATSSLCH